MPLISDSKGIMRLQDAKSFIDRFQKSINARITGMEGKEALALLYDIRGNLLTEETTVNRAAAEIEALLQRLETVYSSAELERITASFHQLVAAQFLTRASVSTFQAHYTRFLELLVAQATAAAAAMLHSEGIEIRTDSWCVLACGGLGRGEPRRGNPGRIILLADNFSELSREDFNLFVYSTLAILEPLLDPTKKRALSGGKLFWSGSAAEWLGMIDAGLSGSGGTAAAATHLGDEELFAEAVAMVADLRAVCGALPLAEAVISSSRQRLATEFSGEKFRQLVRRTTAMPVAIGIFGRFKTARKGRNRGRFPLEELAIAPLASAARIFAIASGITATATVARIKGILARENLGVALADRLLIAYHDFTKTLIELELDLPETGTDEALFFNPEQLAEVDRERFRDGLEAVTTLQRLAYQQLTEAV